VSGLTVGVDLGGTNTRAGLVTESGEITVRSRTPTRLDLGSDGVIEGIASCVNEVMAGQEIDAVGIGAPGPLDPYEGVIISPENLPCMHGVRLMDRLEALLSLPVTVDNDANMAACGEQWLGAGKGVAHFLCITLGTGVGGGWISNNLLMRGFNGNAAEVGHVSIDKDGPRCPCGNYGCLELYASATAMVRRTKERLVGERPETSLILDGLSTEVIFQAAEAGDAFAQEVFEDTGALLGIGIASLASAMNVEVIALCGGLARAGDRLFEPVRRVYADRGTVGVKEYVRIVPGLLGDDAGILGAARLAGSQV
jgi:glucokinase